MLKRLQIVGGHAAIPLFAVLLGLVVGSFFVFLAGANPIQVYDQLFCEGFGSRGCETFDDLLIVEAENDDGELETHFAPFYGERGHGMAIVLEKATPLILTALAATIAFKAGMFSIGMDGQLVLGALMAGFLGYWIPDQIYAATGVADFEAASSVMRTVMHIVVPTLAISAAMIVGAIYSWFAGFLKVKLNVNVLISTIILNAIAVQFVGYMINFPLRADFNNIARTRAIDDSAWLVPFTRGLFSEIEWFRGSRTGVGIIIALIAAFVIWFYLWRSTSGYEQRMTSGSSLFARFSGIATEKAALRAMLISGALSGLAGAIMILGVERRIVDGFASSGTGFDGVLVAILARESIAGIVLVAMFFAGLQQGAINLQFGDLPRQLGGIIIALIILFSAMENFFRETMSHIRHRIAPDAMTQTSDDAVPVESG